MGTKEKARICRLAHPLLTLVSPVFLEHGLATYQLMQQGGYTELVVYAAQQIKQFQLRREEFAMQHLGAQDELKQVACEIAATMSPQELLELLSDAELLQALSPERQEHLRRLLEQRRPADGNGSNPKGS